MDAARALLVASCRFDRPDLREEALELGEAILTKETADVRGRSPVLAAGPWAARSPITINPSYFSPATFAALGKASGDGRWGSLSASSRTITDLLMTDSDAAAARLGAARGRQAGADRPARPSPTATPQFGFDAARTLVRLAEDPTRPGREIAARAWPVFEGREPAEIPVERDLAGKPAGGTQHPMVLVAAAGAADAAGKAERRATAAGRRRGAGPAARRPTTAPRGWRSAAIMLTTDALDCC